MSHLKRFTIFFSKEINVRQTSLYIIYVDDDDDKNSHKLPTGQWYAPSAVINDALTMH